MSAMHIEYMAENYGEPTHFRCSRCHHIYNLKDLHVDLQREYSNHYDIGTGFLGGAVIKRVTTTKTTPKFICKHCAEEVNHKRHCSCFVMAVIFILSFIGFNLIVGKRDVFWIWKFTIPTFITLGLIKIIDKIFDWEE